MWLVEHLEALCAGLIPLIALLFASGRAAQRMDDLEKDVAKLTESAVTKEELELMMGKLTAQIDGLGQRITREYEAQRSDNNAMREELRMLRSEFVTLLLNAKKE